MTWRPSLVPSLLSRIKTLPMAAKNYGEIDTKVLVPLFFSAIKAVDVVA